MSLPGLQEFIHSIEEGNISRRLKFLPLIVVVIGLLVVYDVRNYHAFSAVEAMDAAQVARNLADGDGFSTQCIRPFSIYLLKEHNEDARSNPGNLTNTVDFARMNSPHPDLANAPVYPGILAGLFKITNPDWELNTTSTFWSQSGHFLRYKPEFFIALFNQALFLGAVILTFFIARKLLDSQVAWLSALIMLGLDLLWKFSVSGLSTMLLLVIFLALVWCMVSFEEAGRETPVSPRRVFMLAIMAGVLVGVGMLTRYAFGWLIVPVVAYLILFSGIRRPVIVVATLAACCLVVAPWIVRNLMVSGTFFGTAGYAVVEGTYAFPGAHLVQSVNPDLSAIGVLRPYVQKFFENGRSIMQDDLVRLGGTWMAILFFAGLLLGLRNVAARRMRYFTLMCLGVLIVVQALGTTWLSTVSPETNSENLLVLLTPLVVIFGVVFFLTLLNQMKLAVPELRIVAMVALVLLSSIPLFGTLISRSAPIAYPPYYPPDIQKIAGWLGPNDLIMTDIPWATAWYGNRQSVMTTYNSQSEFYALNDYIKPVNALYLTMDTINAPLLTGCLRGGSESWSGFAFKSIALKQVPRGFPLRNLPADSLRSGLLLTDRPRWR